MADDCIFCKIVAGELPAEIVQEDEHTLAFMDINPWTRGHASWSHATTRRISTRPRRWISSRASLASQRLALTMRERLERPA